MPRLRELSLYVPKNELRLTLAAFIIYEIG